MQKFTLLLASFGMLFFLSCKSAYETQGDTHLSEGQPFKALQRYKYVIQKGNGSKNFASNLTKAYILAMQKTAETELDVDKLISYRDKISEMFSKNTMEASVSDLYAVTAMAIAENLITSNEYPNEELGFQLIREISSLKSKPAKVSSDIASVKEKFIHSYLEKAREHYEACMNGEAEEGIVADYLLSKLTLFVDETPDVSDLWSKIRKANLSTYLMYDLQNLIDKPLPRINRFGVLLAIRAISRSGGSTTIQVQAYNGSTVRFNFLGDGFTLKDSAGNEYKPSGKRGAFSSKTPVEPGQETGVGELSFNVQQDAKLVQLHYNTGSGETIKYLP